MQSKDIFYLQMIIHLIILWLNVNLATIETNKTLNKKILSNDLEKK